MSPKDYILAFECINQYSRNIEHVKRSIIMYTMMRLWLCGHSALACRRLQDQVPAATVSHLFVLACC
jgi:hypothetical protein